MLTAHHFVADSARFVVAAVGVLLATAVSDVVAARTFVF